MDNLWNATQKSAILRLGVDVPQIKQALKEFKDLEQVQLDRRGKQKDQALAFAAACNACSFTLRRDFSPSSSRADGYRDECLLFDAAVLFACDTNEVESIAVRQVLQHFVQTFTQ